MNTSCEYQMLERMASTSIALVILYMLTRIGFNLPLDFVALLLIIGNGIILAVSDCT
jgi:hypothetical protein